MNSTSLLGHSAQLLRIVRKSPQPADMLTSGYLRERKYIGARDRRIISAVVFLSMRCLGSSDSVWSSWCSQSGTDLNETRDHGSVLCTLALTSALGTVEVLHPAFHDESGVSHADQCLAFASEFARSFLSVSNDEALLCLQSVIKLFAEQTASHDAASVALLSCMPEWMVKRWLDQGDSVESIVSLGRALLHPAPLSLRVQTMLAKRSDVLAQLQHLGIVAVPGSLSPHAIVLQERQQLTTLDLYRHGIVEVQDESSQLVAFAVDPGPNDRILDACSGAGGKSLHLACLRSDSGTIYASDLEAKRMRELGARARRAHLQSIHVRPLQQMTEDERQRLRGSFDIVLIDAPCTGMGTVRRSPMLKWRLTPDSLDRMTLKQSDILDDYAQYLKEGGILVYVTCSLLREENENRIEDFLSRHPEFRPDPLVPHLQKHGISTEVPDDYRLSIRPDLHGSDGFFIARLQRQR